MNDIEKSLAKIIAPELKQQYNEYKEKVQQLAIQYQQIKKESNEIAKVIQRMKDENIIDSHLTKLFSLVQDGSTIRRKVDNNQKLNQINQYFQKVQTLSIESLKIIFDIRKFFTNQEFEIFIENQGKVFSFSIEDLESHSGNIIPIYTNSLEKFISNMEKNSRTIAPELTKLGLTLKNLSEDVEIKGIQPYLDFVEYHLKKNKKEKLSENRKLEAAIYLYGRNKDVDFSNKSQRHSLHVMLGIYISKGGTRDTITMYKLGDAIRSTNEGFKNIEIKMHNGTISLTMIANGIKKLNDAFNSENPEEKIIKFFGVKKDQISSPIERAASEEVEKKIKEIFEKISS